MTDMRYAFYSQGDVLLRLTYPAEEEEQGQRANETESTDNSTSNTPATSQSLGVNSLNSQSGSSVPEREVQMLVSSHVLNISSPVFRAMLQASFKEGKTLRDEGKVEISLPDDDPDSFELLMNIVHNRTRRIPRRIEMGQLSDLSILVDKYQMAECLELVLDMYMPHLRESIPVSFSSNLLPWLSITWIFGFAADFKQLTRIAILESEGRLGSPLGDELPFPERVIARIEDERQRHMQLVLQAVQAQIHMFTGPQSLCSYWPSGPGTTYLSHDVRQERARIWRSNCDGMMLGTFLKSASAKGLWPLPFCPLEGLTLRNLIAQAESLEAVSLCYSLDPKDVSMGKAHKKEAVLAAKLMQIRGGIFGLDLETFKNATTLEAPSSNI